MKNEPLYGKKYGNVQHRIVPNDYVICLYDWLNPSRDDVILEIGTSSGSVLQRVQQLSPKAIGADLNYSQLAHFGVKRSIACDAVALPIKDHAISKSFSIHTLEHIVKLSQVFQELERVTRKGGLSFHAFPSALTRGLDGALLDALKITRNPFTAFALARRFHVHNLQPKKIEAFLKDTNWNILKTRRAFVKQEYGFCWMVLLRLEVHD